MWKTNWLEAIWVRNNVSNLLTGPTFSNKNVRKRIGDDLKNYELSKKISWIKKYFNLKNVFTKFKSWLNENENRIFDNDLHDIMINKIYW